MYLCVCVCVCVCVYVCMYALWRYVCMFVCLYYEGMYVCIFVLWRYVCMYECVYAVYTPDRVSMRDRSTTYTYALKQELKVICRYFPWRWVSSLCYSTRTCIVSVCLTTFEVEECCLRDSIEQVGNFGQDIRLQRGGSWMFLLRTVHNTSWHRHER